MFRICFKSPCVLYQDESTNIKHLVTNHNPEFSITWHTSNIRNWSGFRAGGFGRWPSDIWGTSSPISLPDAVVNVMSEHFFVRTRPSLLPASWTFCRRSGEVRSGAGAQGRCHVMCYYSGASSLLIRHPSLSSTCTLLRYTARNKAPVQGHVLTEGATGATHVPRRHADRSLRSDWQIFL